MVVGCFRGTKGFVCELLRDLGAGWGSGWAFRIRPFAHVSLGTREGSFKGFGVFEV